MTVPSELACGALFGALVLSAIEPEPRPASVLEASAQCRLRTVPVAFAAMGALPLHAPPPPPPPCPPEMAQIGASCVDRFEAHLVVVGPDGEERVHPHFERPSPAARYEARSSAGVFPQAYVSRNEAEQACRSAGKRLCTHREWRRACQGESTRRFPYGEDERAGACNNGKEHLFGKVFGNNPSHWRLAEFNSPSLNQEPGFLEKTGERAACRTEEGVFDLVGNVHEWVADTVTTAFVEEVFGDGHYRRKQPWKPGNAVFAGGFYATRAEHGPGCHFVTVAHDRRYHDYTTGFRCCADARPES